MFWLYAGFAAYAVAFFFVKVPETNGRSLEDIEREIRGSEDNSIYRPPRRRRGRPDHAAG